MKLVYRTIKASLLRNLGTNYMDQIDFLKEKPLPKRLMGDGLRLKQVLLNLVRNAVKFTTKGSVHILAGYDSEESVLAIQVIDTGVGLTAEEIPEITQKFGKLYRTAEMNHEGIGLGLTISKALIEANGGLLRIASQGKNRGSVFAFTMDMTKMNAPNAKAASIEEEKVTNTNSSKKKQAEANTGSQSKTLSKESGGGLLIY